jgi:hypothetical protein
VCKLDTNNIPRCFGAPPNSGTGTPCPTGYDWSKPECCKPIGEVCQIREQCCDLAPCVPDEEGVLRCGGGTCSPRGSPCTGTSDTTCCAGTTCKLIAEAGYFCADSQGGVGECVTDGGACTGTGQCCAGACDQGICRVTCQAETASCTVDADCCSGLSCDIAPGATAGACKAPTSGPTCSESGQACTLNTDCCNAPNEQCAEGVCALPPPLCGGLTQVCAVDGDCCEGLYCEDEDVDGVVDGVKQCRELACAPTGDSCTTQNPLCCESGASCRAAGNPSQDCTAGASCACANLSVCAEPSAPCAPTQSCCDSRQYCGESSSIAPCTGSSASCVCKSQSAG